MGPEQERVIRLIVDVGEGGPRGGLRLLKSPSAGFSMRQRFAMQAWTLVWLFLFRPTPPPFHAWRRRMERMCWSALSCDSCIHETLTVVRAFINQLTSSPRKRVLACSGPPIS
jgi:hypothetical protein